MSLKNFTFFRLANPRLKGHKVLEWVLFQLPIMTEKRRLDVLRPFPRLYDL